jgi:hypothetical protein
MGQKGTVEDEAGPASLVLIGLLRVHTVYSEWMTLLLSHDTYEKRENE